MPTYTPEDLRTLHPKVFEKEYERWQEYALYDDWAEWIQSGFKVDMEYTGIHVDNFWWDISYSQSDGASFDGRVIMHVWMEATQYDEEQTFAEKYPVLYLACKQDGSYVNVSTRNRGHYQSFSINESWWGTDPCGIFSGLDQDAWCELVEDQATVSGIEDEIRATCGRFMKDLYYKLRDEHEEITSEDAFVESCNNLGITFEVEGEDTHVAA